MSAARPTKQGEPRNCVILGAAGRDFHNFNVFFRANDRYRVVAFTAAQIPDIEGRRYPAGELAGPLYPEGIPIRAESELGDIIREEGIDDVFFAYSDVSYDYMGSKMAEVHAAGASFAVLGPRDTMIQPSKPLLTVTATRTGCGKSQTVRYIAAELQKLGLKVAAIRHPMPYGDLSKQICQRYATYADLDKYECTIEEREEYEPAIDNGVLMFAGVDYAKILAAAEAEADIIMWDGGNNDWSFYGPSAQMNICVADPHRAGDERRYWPGEVNLRTADIIVINKLDSADQAQVLKLRDNCRELNPNATIVDAASPLFVDDPSQIKGKRVLCIEDGPTTTHGGMKYGAAFVAAQKFGAAEIVDPRPFATGKIARTFEKYPDIGCILPAMGYGAEQTADLEKTVDAANVDLVISGTPIDLTRVLKVSKPMLRVRYDLQVIGQPSLAAAIADKFKHVKKPE
jgi:predicted GTPase